MHRCFLVPEIQSLIFKEFYIEDYGHATPDVIESTETACFKALFALALTCHRFTETALDLLWKDISSLKILVAVMPTDLWTITETEDLSAGIGKHRTLIFVRDIQDSDWDRFNYYASKIRSLTEDRHHPSYVSVDRDAILSLKRCCQSKPLIPRLQSVGLPYLYDFSDASLFLCETLEDICLDLICLDLPEAVFPVLIDIPRLCPRIETIHIGASTRIGTTWVAKLEDMLMQLFHLQSLSHLWEPSVNLEKHLGTLPFFSYWSTGRVVSGSSDQIVFTTAGNRFQSLREFRFDVNTWTDANRILQEMQCRFVALNVRTRPRRVLEDLGPIFDFLKTISQHVCRTTLTYLNLSDKVDEVNVVTQWDSLDPLFHLSALEELDLNISEVKFINDAWLERAAATWSSLRYLYIRRLTQATLMGLALLLSKCPNLDAAVSAVWRPLDPQLLFRLPVNHTVEDIMMGFVIIEGDVLAVLRNLLALFPRLRRLDGEVGRGEEQQWKWEKLQKYLRRSLPDN